MEIFLRPYNVPAIEAALDISIAWLVTQLIPPSHIILNTTVVAHPGLL